MKSRRYNLIIGVFVMFISNIIYFFWMPYPKGFLKTVGSTTLKKCLILRWIMNLKEIQLK